MVAYLNEKHARKQLSSISFQVQDAKHLHTFFLLKHYIKPLKYHKKQYKHHINTSNIKIIAIYHTMDIRYTNAHLKTINHCLTNMTLHKKNFKKKIEITINFYQIAIRTTIISYHIHCVNQCCQLQGFGGLCWMVQHSQFLFLDFSSEVSNHYIPENPSAKSIECQTQTYYMSEPIYLG